MWVGESLQKLSALRLLFPLHLPFPPSHFQLHLAPFVSIETKSDSRGAVTLHSRVCRGRFVALIGCRASPLQQKIIMFHLAFLPSPVSHPLLFSLISFVSFLPSLGGSWPVEPCVHVEPCTQLCPWHAFAQHLTACERLTYSGTYSMWPRCSCHPLNFLMQFVPLLVKVMDFR